MARVPISGVIAAIRAGVTQLTAGKALLLAATTHFDEARSLIEQATSGTSRPEPAQAVAAFTDALQRIGELLAHHDAAIEALTTYLSHIAAGTTAPAAPQPPHCARPPLPSEQPRPGHPGGWVEQLRAELPPALKGKSTGRKTHGRGSSATARPAQSSVVTTKTPNWPLAILPRWGRRSRRSALTWRSNSPRSSDAGSNAAASPPTPPSC